MEKKTVPLNFTFLGISEEAEGYALNFFKRCQEKFAKGEAKYGYVRGNTPFPVIFNHLLCEFGELILAVEGENWQKSLEVIREAIKERLLRENRDSDIVGELADVTNIPVLVYVCGRVQGVING